MANRLFSRNLAKYGKPITLQNRAITSPLSGTPDFTESFTNDQNVQAIVKTVRGKTFFDGVSTESIISHEMRIEFIAGVTAETWVILKGRRIDILAVENCCEEDEVLILTCSDRGTGAAAQA